MKRPRSGPKHSASIDMSPWLALSPWPALRQNESALMTSPALIVFSAIQIGVDRVLDEPDGAVAHSHVDAAGVAAPGAGEGVVVAGAGDAGQLRTGSDVQKRSARCSAGRRRWPGSGSPGTPFGVNRVMNERRRGCSTTSCRGRRTAAPWSTSPMKTVLLVPSVIEAKLMFTLWPNADWR